RDRPQRLRRSRPGRRRQRLPAAVAGDPSEHARRSSGGGAVPHARRRAHLRHGLHPDPRGQQHPDAFPARLQPADQPAEPRARLSGVGPALHHRDHHRVHLRQGIPDRSRSGSRGALMATIAATGSARRAPGTREIPMDKRKIKPLWVVGSILIVLYAIIPILWILSLSLKPQSDITDGSVIPKHFSWVNYSTIFSTGVFVRPLINSIGITLISTVIAVGLATLAAYAIARLNFPG